MTVEKKKKKVLKAILKYEKQFNSVDDYKVKTEIGYLYEIIRSIGIDLNN